MQCDTNRLIVSHCIFTPIQLLHTMLWDNEVVSMAQEVTLNNTNPLDGGDYQCTVTNDAGNDTAMTTLDGEI